MIEKLDIQPESFQKEFNLFLKSKNVPERVTTFKELIRLIFKIDEIFLVYKKSIEAEWELFLPEKKQIPRDSAVVSIALSGNTEYYEGLPYNDSIIVALSDASFFGILLGQKLTTGDYSETDLFTLHLLLKIFDNESNTHISKKKEKDLIFNLNEKILQLNNLIDTGIELSRFDKREVLFELSLERACALLNASSAMLRIMNNKKELISEFVFPGETHPDLILNNELKIESSFEFNNYSYAFTLSEKETRMGSTSFSDLDIILLNAISRQVYVVIENEFLQQEILLKQRYEQELSVAASIQQRIIPDKLPKIDGHDLAGINIPSREVGGDYYDCIDMGKDKYALIIADVSGKGMPAALLVNTLNAALYSYLEFEFPLCQMTDKLNKLIYNSSPVDKFITFFIAILNVKTGELDAVNAGHNPVLLLRKDGSLEMINAGGVGLGMFNLGIPYVGQKLMMYPGDKLFLYTDGIPEAMNINQDEYSDERMITFVKSNSDKSAEELIKGIVKDVKTHSGTAEQSDDITALYLIRKE